MADCGASVLVASRRWVAERSRGATLEVGVGGWPSLAYYPEHCTLTGLDRQPRAVASARRRAALLGRDAVAVEGDAMALAFDDDTFDTVVFSFSLCGVPEVRGALIQALRVLRPGGSLLMADHIEATSTPLRALQRVVEGVTRPMFGEHFTRRPSLAARELDIEIVEIERRSRGAIERVSARKPA